MTAEGVPELVYSKHALERLAEMHVGQDECASVRSYPLRSYWSQRHQSTVHQGRRIAVCTRPGDEPGTEHVNTVLWTDEDTYTALGLDRPRWDERRRQPLRPL